MRQNLFHLYSRRWLKSGNRLFCYFLPSWDLQLESHNCSKSKCAKVPSLFSPVHTADKQLHCRNSLGWCLDFSAVN